MTILKIQFATVVHCFICELKGNIFASGNLVTAFFPYIRTCDSKQFCNSPITAYPSDLLFSLHLFQSIDALQLNTTGAKVLIQKFAK
jgi:hypothetical protein